MFKIDYIKTLRNIGFSKYWAGVTSRAIVFALF